MTSIARRAWLVMGVACAVLLLSVAGVQAMDWQLHKETTVRAMFSKGALGSTIESFLPDFEKQTGIKVQFETFPEDQFRQKVLLELGAGTGALVLFWTFAANEGLKFWRSGWYEPLDAYLKDPRLTDPAYDLADISKKAMEGNIYDGKLIALPTRNEPTRTGSRLRSTAWSGTRAGQTSSRRSSGTRTPSQAHTSTSPCLSRRESSR